MKSMIENDFIQIDDLETIYELGNFIAKNDKYEADEGCHDDCVMTLVIFAWLSKQDWFMDEFGRNIATDLYKRATEDKTFKLPVCGGVQYAEPIVEEAEVAGVGNVKVVTAASFSEWAGT